MDERPAFAVTLRRRRAEAGLSQEQLAERAGLSVRGLRYLEGGLRHPYRSTAERLAQALRLGPEAAAALLAAASRPAPARPTSPGASGLPVPPGPLVGRERELRAALHLWERGDVRLLTVTGAGGVGKTRFALELAARLGQAREATVVWAPLADVADPALVPVSVARAAGVTVEDPQRLLEALAGTLADQVLLLDNTEHLLGSAAFVDDLVNRCPSLAVVVTSRACLGLRTEHRFLLDPLRTPESTAGADVHALAVNPAVDLFVARAQHLDPDFTLTPATAPAVAEICRRLEGLPLALELAAARTAVLPPAAMSRRLEHGLPLLVGGAADLPERHRTMRATIAWSHVLLDPAARTLFRRLAVFEGGVGLRTVDALAADRAGDASGVLEALETLVRSSLLRVDVTRGDEPRYRMHELVREYALEELARQAEERRVRAWHAHHFLSLAQEAERHLHGPESTDWLDRLEVEHADLRAALRWCREHDRADLGLRLAAALSWFWYVRGHATEGRSQLVTLLAAAGPSAPADVRLAALLGLGQLAQTQGDYAAARRVLEEAAALGRATGDQPGTAAALLAAGFVARIQEDYAAAGRLLGEAAVLAEAAGSALVVAATRHHLGAIAADAHGDLGAARSLLEEALSAYRRLGMGRGEALVLLSLGQVAGAQGDLTRAARLARESLALMRDTGERLAVHGALDLLAELAVAAGDPARGLRLAGAAERLRELGGIRSWPVVERRRDRVLALARSAVTLTECRSLWDHGRALPLEDAVRLALGEAPAPPLG